MEEIMEIEKNNKAGIILSLRAIIKEVRKSRGLSDENKSMAIQRLHDAISFVNRGTAEL